MLIVTIAIISGKLFILLLSFPLTKPTTSGLYLAIRSGNRDMGIDAKIKSTENDEYKINPVRPL
jgi:hypothetical protein